MKWKSASVHLEHLFLNCLPCAKAIANLFSCVRAQKTNPWLRLLVKNLKPSTIWETNLINSKWSVAPKRTVDLSLLSLHTNSWNLAERGINQWILHARDRTRPLSFSLTSTREDFLDSCVSHHNSDRLWTIKYVV